RVPRARRGSGAGGGDGPTCARARPRRAHLCTPGAAAAPADRPRGRGRGVTRLVAIVPAWNEEGAIGTVVAEIRAFDPSIDVVVVDDASTDETVEVAQRRGATVLALPFNVGIGGAVQTGFRYARDEGYAVAVRLDGDGQHDASELGKLLEPVLAGEADV